MKTTQANSDLVTFIGGGNMASALIRGLIKNNKPPSDIFVIDTNEETRLKLSQDFGVICVEEPIINLDWLNSSLIVWAVKPQQMREVCESYSSKLKGSLHLSVAAGITTNSLCKWLTTERVARAMPNTPALIGMGQTALYASNDVSSKEKALIESVIKGTGEFLWLEDEELINAVTAVSGSGPAYVFYFLEALTQTGVELGLTPEQSRRLAIGTFIGASNLANQSPDSLSTLRERVTSKGGTTETALSSLNNDHVALSFQNAVKSAHSKARQLGSAFGN